MESGKLLKFLCVSACGAELIGELFVGVNSLVKKLFLGVFFHKKIPDCPDYEFFLQA
jgi:hypothetical protein